MCGEIHLVCYPFAASRSILARIHEIDDFFNCYFSLIVDTPIICRQFDKISEFFGYRFHFAEYNCNPTRATKNQNSPLILPKFDVYFSTNISSIECERTKFKITKELFGLTHFPPRKLFVYNLIGKAPSDNRHTHALHIGLRKSKIIHKQSTMKCCCSTGRDIFVMQVC